MKEYIFPRTVLSENSATCTNLLKKQPLQIDLSENKTTFFKSGSSLILDFGKEISGGVRVLTYKAANVSVRIRFGESLTECCAELGGEKNATNDHSLRDLIVHLQDFSDMSFGQTGFRFVRFDFDGDIEIKCVVAESYRLRKPVVYAYNGEDRLIKNIYECAKHTVDLCASKGYVWDGVKRDRLVWIGDMYPEMLALTSLYGQVKEVEDSLNFARKQTPLPGWVNGFPMYSMWWIIILADYYKRTNRRAFAERQLEYVKGLVSLMNSHVKEDGTLDYHFYFVDWPTHDQPDKLHGARAINILSVKKAISLLNEFSEDTSIAERLLEKLLKIPMEPLINKQIIALKYFATNELSETEKGKLIEGGARGLSTFMSYFILKAISSFDREKAIDIMKEYYGAMLDKGATTFWEDFNIEWAQNSCRIDELPQNGQKDIHGDFGAYCYIGFRHSLCHGWSAGVITFIEEEC